MSFYRQLLILAGLGVVLLAVLGLRVAPVVLGEAALPAEPVAPVAADAAVLLIKWGPPGNARKARLEAIRERRKAAVSSSGEVQDEIDPR